MSHPLEFYNVSLFFPMTNGTIDEAPTPQNTPANATSYMGNAAAGIPPTISEGAEGVDLAQLAQLAQMGDNPLLSNPLLKAMIESKLQTLVGEDSGYIGGLPRELKHRIYALKALEMDQFALEAKFQMRLLELEREFAGLFGEVNAKRRALVTGAAEAEPEAVALGRELLEEEEEEEEEEEDDAEEAGDDKAKAESSIKGIPGFWLTALQNVPLANTLITDRDFDVLDALIDIRMEYLDTPGYKLVFEFEENDFFTNKTLTKTYYYQKELGYTGEFVYERSEGCEVDWKSVDVNVTVEVEQRKQRNKHTKQVRVVEKTSHVESFFNFFAPPALPEDEEEVDEDLAQALQIDYALGELVKDKLIPRAIDCFTGEALGNGLFDGEEEEEDFEDEDEDGEDDDEDDDDDEEEEGDNVVHEKGKECANQ